VNTTRQTNARNILGHSNGICGAAVLYYDRSSDEWILEAWSFGEHSTLRSRGYDTGFSFFVVWMETYTTTTTTTTTNNNPHVVADIDIPFNTLGAPMCGCTEEEDACRQSPWKRTCHQHASVPEGKSRQTAVLFMVGDQHIESCRGTLGEQSV